MKKQFLSPPIFFSLLFASLSFIGILHHEMWLDETQSWLMACDAHSISQLFDITKFNGHPHLWDILLFFLSQFTRNPFAMQVMHVCISSLTIFLFLKYAPVPLLQKLCIVFGYYFFFEYNLIARNYSLAWLLLVVFCILFSKDKRNYFLLCIVLLFLSNTHLFALVCSLPLFFLVWQSARKDAAIKNNKQFIFGSLLFLCGIAISVWSILPASGTLVMHNSNEHLFSAERLTKSISFFVKSFYCIPDFTSLHWWNSNYFISHFKWLTILLTPVLIFIPLFLFYNRKNILILFYFSTFTIIILQYYLQLFGGTRYVGFGFMILITSQWLAHDARMKQNLFSSSRVNLFLEKAGKYFSIPFLASILFCQLFAGVFAYCSDYKNAFSEGKNAAEFIRENCSSNAVVIVHPYISAPPVAAYLNKEIYYSDLYKFARYWEWKIIPSQSEHEWFVQTEAWMKNYSRLLSGAGEFAIVLSASDSLPVAEHELCALDKNFFNVKTEKKFDDGNVRGENYVVYLIDKK